MTVEKESLKVSARAFNFSKSGLTITDDWTKKAGAKLQERFQEKQNLGKLRTSGPNLSDLPS